MDDATTQLEPRFCSECGRPTPADELAHFGDHLVCPYCKETYVQKLREGVTGPAGAFRFAGFWIRFVARLLDDIILGIAAGAINMLIFGSLMPNAFRVRPNPTPEEAMAALGPMMAALGLAMVVGLVLGGIYETFFVARAGATPGKMALSLKVVRPDGGKISVGRAAGRYFAKILSGMILAIGYIIAGFDAEKRGLHDMICDTRVIRVQN
jgi:uncharacterized RDD family membrane protein YckC